MSYSTLGVIILAAGSSSRMGQSKQLLTIDAVPLLRRSVLTAVESEIGEVLVVLGAQADQHRTIIDDLPIQVLINSNWHLGMGHSLKYGLQHLLIEKQSWNGVVVMVCDQPAVTVTHLKRLVQTHLQQRDKIIASAYQQVAGVPALLPKMFFDQLLLMEDQQGARKIIQREKENVITVALEKGEFDLDTPEDYRKWQQQ